MPILTVYSGDSQLFQIDVYDQTGVTAVTPLSGFFMITRVNDDSLVFPEVSGTISGNNVSYNWTATGIGFMKYLFTVQVDNTLKQTTENYFQVVEK